MKTKSFCTLAFFSAHFNVPAEKLSWCLIKDVTAGKTLYHAGVAIPGSNLAIDICRGQFVSKFNLKDNKVEFLEATAKWLKNEKMLCFSPADKSADELVLTEKDLEAVYQYRWYTPDLEKKLIL